MLFLRFSQWYTLYYSVAHFSYCSVISSKFIFLCACSSVGQLPIWKSRQCHDDVTTCHDKNRKNLKNIWRKKKKFKNLKIFWRAKLCLCITKKHQKTVFFYELFLIVNKKQIDQVDNFELLDDVCPFVSLWPCPLLCMYVSGSSDRRSLLNYR